MLTYTLTTPVPVTCVTGQLVAYQKLQVRISALAVCFDLLPCLSEHKRHTEVGSGKMYASS